MWTTENRARYDPSHLRYPSDLIDEEWALTAPRIPAAGPSGWVAFFVAVSWAAVNQQLSTASCAMGAVGEELSPVFEGVLFGTYLRQREVDGTVNSLVDVTPVASAPWRPVGEEAPLSLAGRFHTVPPRP